MFETSRSFEIELSSPIRIDNYMNNPMVLWNFNSGDTIGKVTSLEVKGNYLVGKMALREGRYVSLFTQEDKTRVAYSIADVGGCVELLGISVCAKPIPFKREENDEMTEASGREKQENKEEIKSIVHRETSAEVPEFLHMEGAVWWSDADQVFKIKQDGESVPLVPKYEQSLEKSYVAGSKRAWRDILALALAELGWMDEADGSPTDWKLAFARLVSVHEDTIASLREACRKFGDNDWDDKLHPTDIIEKHLINIIKKDLAPHLRASDKSKDTKKVSDTNG